MMNRVITAASRLENFDKPTVWSLMTPLAIRTNSINLGQGFPAWQPPKFYQQYLKEFQGCNHQYTRAFGSLPLVEAIANFQRKTYKNINPQTDICTVNGGVQGLYDCIMGLVNAGQEVMFFDPSYDCYRAQIQMAGAKAVGLPLLPKYKNSKKSIQERCKNGYKSGPQDDWQIDYEKFQALLNQKTRMFIFNTPHNPIGKVFTNEQIAKIANILKKYPKVVVVEDNVYEGMTFDDMFQKQLPKMAFQQGMYDRTLSVYSAGKIFAATGVRSGWVIGPGYLIRAVRSVHQYNVFCMYNPVENTVAKSLNHISRPEDDYMKSYAQTLQKNRDILLDQLLESKFDFDLWIPKGGYFILADISKIKIADKYMQDDDGNSRTRDWAFCYQLAHEEGVVGIPCTPFYSKEDSKLGETYVRFAFCKKAEMILEAGKRLK